MYRIGLQCHSKTDCDLLAPPSIGSVLAPRWALSLLAIRRYGEHN